MFPFSHFSLKGTSAKIVVMILWAVAFCVSVIPTISVGSDSDVYGLSDVCIGLPLITKASGIDFQQVDISNPLENQQLSIPVATGQKPAWVFSVVLFIGVNLVSFLVVFGCYVAIFVEVKRTSKKVKSGNNRNRETDIRMAVKMALLVMTDFACWMPVIIMGILSQTNMVPISPEVYAWVVVFILPINSTLNPFLYTFFTACISSRRSDKSQTQTSRARKVNVQTASASLRQCRPIEMSTLRN